MHAESMSWPFKADHSDQRFERIEVDMHDFLSMLSARDCAPTCGSASLTRRNGLSLNVANDSGKQILLREK